MGHYVNENRSLYRVRYVNKLAEDRGEGQVYCATLLGVEVLEMLDGLSDDSYMLRLIDYSILG